MRNHTIGRVFLSATLMTGAVACGGEDVTQDQDQEESTIVRGTSFSSTGDPHEVTGDGLAFENQLTGWFTAVKSPDLVVLKNQNTCNDIYTCNLRVGVRLNGTKLVADKSGAIYLNGSWTKLSKAVSFADGVTLTPMVDTTWGGTGVHIANLGGDAIDVWMYGTSINIYGTLSPWRLGNIVRGSIGCLDPDLNPNNDLCRRDPTSPSFAPSQVATFLEHWRSTADDFASVGCGPKGC